MWKNIHLSVLVLFTLAIATILPIFNNTSNHQFEPITIETYEPVVVLELFTSQGCSSCPSADILLQKVKEAYKEDVFALSYHVDYWNYIGWKDPFSKAIYAEKQRKYNLKFKNRSNYTPQLVVNGKEHFVGSNSASMYQSIETYKKKKSMNQVSLRNVQVNKNDISFDYDLKGLLKDKNLRAVLVLDQRATAVKRGENKNRTLKNSNVVVEEVLIHSNEHSGSEKITIPKIVKPGESLNLMVLVENLDYDITGAAKMSIMQ